MRYFSGFKIKSLLSFALICISPISLAEYIELEPAFVVNLASDSEIKFAQVSVQVSVEGHEAAQALETHKPAIRDALIMLLSSKSAKGVSSRDGKQQLREEAVQAIRHVMDEQHVKFSPPEHEDEEKESKDNEKKNNKYASTQQHPSSPIKDVFFTRFIIQ